MVMDQKALEDFRVRYRLLLLEQLVLRHALLEPAIHRRLPIRESATELKGWLEKNSALADRAYGAALADPALAALYADEAKEIVEEMKKDADQIAAGMEKYLAEH
jgi:hypothetical protein